MDLVHKMIKNKKWGVRGGQAEAGGWDGLSGGWEVGNNVVGYQIVGDGDGSKGIAIK